MKTVIDPLLHVELRLTQTLAAPLATKVSWAVWLDAYDDWQDVILDQLEVEVS